MWGVTNEWELIVCRLIIVSVCVCWRRVRSDSVQSDQKFVQEEMEEETESSQDKKLPGSVLARFWTGNHHFNCSNWSCPTLKHLLFDYFFTTFKCYTILSVVWYELSLSLQWHLRIRRGKTLREETWSWRRDVTLCRSNRGKSMSDWLLWRERSRRGRWWYWSLISILSAHCPIVIVPATFSHVFQIYQLIINSYYQTKIRAFHSVCSRLFSFLQERERLEQERRRQHELEKQLEKQRDFERQREEERRKEIERREVTRRGNDSRICILIELMFSCCSCLISFVADNREALLLLPVTCFTC